MPISLILDITKGIDENASAYFENAKKMRKKSKGIDKALAQFTKQRDTLLKKQARHHERQAAKVEPYKPQHWYEKFRWFTSSEGALCIGGRDATQNEILIKKHLDADDLIFHTDAPGSPFFVVKAQGNTLSTTTYEEAAQATFTYSRAWKLGITSGEVFSVTPEQISKQAESGEYLTKGSFMIRGKRTYYRTSIALAIGEIEGHIIAGPPNAITHYTKNHVTLIPENFKASEAAKHIKQRLNYAGHLDDIIRFLPAGKIGIAR